jgi:hypothetical protein
MERIIDEDKLRKFTYTTASVSGVASHGALHGALGHVHPLICVVHKFGKWSVSDSEHKTDARMRRALVSPFSAKCWQRQIEASIVLQVDECCKVHSQF